MKNSGMTKMTLRDIAKNFLQYLSMIVIVMLAVTLFCGFISNTLTLKKTIDDYYKASNLTDIICQYTSISADDRDFLQSLSGVDEIEYRFYCEGSVNQKSAKIYAADSDNQISVPIIKNGTRGVLVDQNVAKRDYLSIGDEINIEIPYGNTKFSSDFEITGLMNFAEVAATHTTSPVYLDFDVLTAAIAPISKDMITDQVVIKAKSPQIVKDAINAHYQSTGAANLIFVYDRNSMESVIMLNTEVSQSLKMIYVFPVIFLIVSILVILSTIGPLILRERTNIGTLKGVGVSNRRILLHYAFIGVLLCLIGGIIGVVIGPFIIPNVLLIKYSILYSLPRHAPVVFSWLWSIIAILAVSILSLVIGVFVCSKTIKEKPASCMRPLPPRDSFILRHTTRGLKAANKWTIPIKMASRNILLKPIRAVMTVIGVMGCVALLVCSFGIGDTVNNSINLELGGQFKYDISTGYTQNDFVSKIDELENNGQIEYYETTRTYYVSVKAANIKDVKIYVLPANPRLTTINPNGKVLISKSIAEDLGVKAGGEVTLSVSGCSVELTVDEIIQTAYTKGIFVDDASVFGDSLYTSAMWIKASGADMELVNYINTINGTNDALTMETLRGNVHNTISSISTIKLTMMLFAIALAVVVLYNLSLLNVKERVRDIATMKVLGFTQGQIGLSLLYEIMFLVLFGTCVGLMLGFPITYLVLSINKIEVLTFIYRVKSVSYVISAAISLFAAFLINLLFTYRIRRINMIESLKSVE